jgi:heat shock protein 90kDa beta
VADEVQVASLPPKTSQNPNPVQSIFSSKTDGNSFETFADPRGNTLGHGTEITLMLREDADEFLDTILIKELV